MENMETVGNKKSESKSTWQLYAYFWQIAWPVMLTTGAVTLFSIVDMAWVGRLGVSQVAAVSLGSSIVRIVIGLAESVKTGVLAVSARHSGARNDEEFKKVAGISWQLGLCVALIVCIPLGIFAPSIIGLFDVEKEVIGLGVSYLRIVLLGMIFLYGSMAVSMVFQGAGNTRVFMKVAISTNLLNIILDPILIFGWGPLPPMGVAGAAVATTLSNMLGFAISLVYLYSKKMVEKVKIISFPQDMPIIRDIFRIGIPDSIRAITRPLSGMILNYLVALYGTQAVAAFGIGLRITAFTAVFSSGLTAATSTLVGQFLGAERKKEADKIAITSIIVGSVMFALIGAAYFIFARSMIAFFVEDETVIDIGALYLKYVSICLILIGVFASLGGVFMGSGHTRQAMTSSLIANWPFKLGMAYFFGFIWPGTLNGIWLAISLSVFIETALLYYWYKKPGWRS